MEEEHLADHPEIELTKLSQEIDWNSSIWPIKNKNIHFSPVENFQYKLKTQALITPQIRYQSNYATDTISQLTSPICLICNSEEDADLEHIFSKCTVAMQYNTKLWIDLQNIPGNDFTQPWFTVQNNGKIFAKAEWNLLLGDQGYIPSAITSKTVNAIQEILCQKVAESRHALWKDYWSKFIALSNVLPTEGSSQSPSSPTVTSTMGGTVQQSYSQQETKKRQTKITSFFQDTSNIAN